MARISGIIIVLIDLGHRSSSFPHPLRVSIAFIQSPLPSRPMLLIPLWCILIYETGRHDGPTSAMIRCQRKETFVPAAAAAPSISSLVLNYLLQKLLFPGCPNGAGLIRNAAVPVYQLASPYI